MKHPARRWFSSLSLGLCLLTGGLIACKSTPASHEPAEAVAVNVAPDPYAFELTTIDGQPKPLADYRGKVLLIVNVASRCGYTPQYAGLEELHQKYAEQGLVVMGVPSNDFGRQEPGSNEEIRAFCSSKFNVTFPMFEKVAVKDDGQHPLYGWLTAQKGEVTWNFNKFLVAKSGKLLARYESKVEPLSKELTSAIEAALGGA